MKILFADSNYKLYKTFKENYLTEVKKTYAEVTKVLPFCSRHINFFIQPREFDLIPETQDNGHTHNSELIALSTPLTRLAILASV